MNKAKRDDNDYPPSFVLHLKRIDCDRAEINEQKNG